MKRVFLTDGQIVQVIKRLIRGESYKSISRDFGVSRLTIYTIGHQARKHGVDVPKQKRNSRDWNEIISQI